MVLMNLLVMFLGALLLLFPAVLKNIDCATKYKKLEDEHYAETSNHASSSRVNAIIVVTVVDVITLVFPLAIGHVHDENDHQGDVADDSHS